MENRYCVYTLTNRITGHTYVGLSKNPSGRARTHLNKKKEHQNKHIRRDMAAFGVDVFDFKVLFTGLSVTEARETEKRTISDLHCKHPFGYNISAGGGTGNVRKDGTVSQNVIDARLRWLRLMKEPLLERYVEGSLGWPLEQGVSTMTKKQSADAVADFLRRRQVQLS